MSPVVCTPDRLDLLLTPSRTEEIDLAALFLLLADRHYSGALTLHFQNGRPRVVELPAPKFTLAP